MQRTPVKIEFEPAIKLSDPLQIEIDVDKSRIFKFPKQVFSAVEPFDLVWLEDESKLALVEEFSDPADPIETLEYKEIQDKVYELDPRVEGQYQTVTLEIRFSDKDDQALDKGFGQYYIRVTPPEIVNSIQDDIVVDIPPSGRLSLDLLPSVNYFSIDRYKVRYFHKGNTRKPVQTEYWAVPYKKPNFQERITVPSPVDSHISLPPYFYSISDLSYSLDGIKWQEGWSFFYFLQGYAPPEGEEIDLTLEQAYTREEIVEYGYPRRYYSYYSSRWI